MSSTPIERPIINFQGMTEKFDRASRHLEELTTAVRAFIATDPIAIERALDAENRRLLFVSRIRGTPPLAWSSIIGDIAHNLRCTLDFLVYELFMWSTGEYPSRETRTQFPICTSRSQFRNACRQNRQLNNAAMNFLESVQPFEQGPTHPLVALNVLSNWDKHRSIAVAAAAISSAELLVPVEPGHEGFRSVIVETFVRDGTVFGMASLPFSDALELQMQRVGHGQINLEYCFFQPTQLRGVVALRAIVDMQRSVGEILTAAAAELLR